MRTPAAAGLRGRDGLPAIIGRRLLNSPHGPIQSADGMPLTNRCEAMKEQAKAVLRQARWSVSG